MKIPRRCADVPHDPEAEARCTESYHWDDGVPYCDKCGLYRNSVAIAIAKAKADARRKP